MAGSKNSDSSSNKNAYDMTEISIPSHDAVEVEDQQSILSGVPSQKSYHSRRSKGSLSLTSNMSEEERELNSFPLALTSKLFFLVGCAMYLWLSIDDLRWAHEARTIPASVLEADDDVTWRSFRSSQQQQQQSASSTGNGYTRPATASNGEDEDGIAWSDVRDTDFGGTRHRHLRASPSKPSPSGRRGLVKVPPPQSTTKATPHTTLRKLVDETFSVDWDELPFSTQIAAATLGHDEATWNSGGATFTDLIPWDDLSAEQQDAAVSLGYTEYLWNFLRGFTEPDPAQPSGVTQSTQTVEATNREPTQTTAVNTETATETETTTFFRDTSTATPTTTTGTTSESTLSSMPVAPNGNWRSYPWNELPSEIQGGAVALGFTEPLWDAGAELSTGVYFWDELSPAQQEASAAIFGYNRITWNASNRKWQTIDWNDLPQEIRTDAIALGYDERLWKVKADIDTESYDWEQLSGAQQQAAFTVFGYTEDTWTGTSETGSSGSDTAPSDSVSKAVSENQDVKNGGGGRGGGRGGADDDYVFNVERQENDVWVSKYQIVYFVASICFMIVGILGKKCSVIWYQLCISSTTNRSS